MTQFQDELRVIDIQFDHITPYDRNLDSWVRSLTFDGSPGIPRGEREGKTQKQRLQDYTNLAGKAIEEFDKRTAKMMTFPRVRPDVDTFFVWLQTIFQFLRQEFRNNHPGYNISISLYDYYIKAEFSYQE